MDIDDFYVETNNQFGKRQKFWVGLLSLFATYAPFQMLQVVFTGRAPSFNCTIGNVTHDSSACGLTATNGTFFSCDALEYDPQMDSFVKEWASAPCQSDLSPLAQMALMLGVMVGALSLGPSADSFGRKPILLASLLGTVVFGALGAYLAPTFVFFVGCRFLVGVGSAGILMCSFVLISEIVGPRERGLCGNLFQAACSVGIMGYAGLAYFIQADWRMLSMTCSILGLPVLALTAFTPESPRWLYANGKREDGLKTLRRLTRLPSTQDVQIIVTPAQEGQCGQVIEMLKLKPLMIAIQVFSWFVNSVVYYALTLSAHSLGSNIYMSTFLSGLVELPALFLTGILIDRIGRRLPLAIFMILAGLSVIVCQVVDPINSATSFYLALFGKLCIAGSFSIIYIHSSELFPTVVRNSGVGLCTSGARVGGIVASYFVAGSHTFWELVGLGGLAVCSGCLNLSLPETLNEKLPENLKDLKRKPKDDLDG